MKIFCKKKGFTLVEIIVVIAILAVLSMLAVNGYTQYRRSTLLDLSADNVISQIYEFHDKTVHGNFDSSRFDEIKASFEGDRIDLEEDGEARLNTAKCYKVFFEKNDEGYFDIFTFSQPFLGKKVWNFGLNNWVYTGCSDEEDATFFPFELDEMAKIENISLIDSVGEGTEISENFIMRFVPPKGILEISYDNGLFIDDFTPGSGGMESVEIQIKYGASEENEYKRKINYKFFSNSAFVTKIYEDE